MKKADLIEQIKTAIAELDTLAPLQISAVESAKKILQNALDN